MSQTKVAVGMIDATGTASSSTFLRGDSAWSAPTGGLVFISNTDISAAATYDFESFTAGSYEHYQFHLQNLIPATDDRLLWVRTSTDGGSSYDSGGSDYMWAVSCNGALDTDDADAQISLNGDATDIETTVGSASNESGVSGLIQLFGPHTTSYSHIQSTIMYRGAGGNASISHGGGQRLEAADIDGFRILFESGNIESGTVTAFGIVNA